MSEGKDKYDERMRLRAENDLLREQNVNKQLKNAATSFELEGLVSLAVISFLI